MLQSLRSQLSYDGSFRLSVAGSIQRELYAWNISPTFEMKKYSSLIVLEHLCDQLHVHVLHIDLLL